MSVTLYFTRLQKTPTSSPIPCRFVDFAAKVSETAASRLGNGGCIFDGVTVTHSTRLHGQHGHAGRGGPITVGCNDRVGVVVDQGVPDVTRGGGDGGGKGNGHEAEAFALQILHGGAHVFLHELGHLLLRHGQAVVGGGRRRRLVAVGVSGMGPTVGVGLDAVTTAALRTQMQHVTGLRIEMEREKKGVRWRKEREKERERERGI